MSMKGPLQTPFDEAVAPISDGSPAGGGTSGGFDLGAGSQSETPNSLSGLPLQPTTVAVEGAPSAPGTQVAWPPVDSPGTIQA